jgi:hypothetical protein
MEKDAAGYPSLPWHDGLVNELRHEPYLAGRLPYRTSGLEWGKDREVLPITTGEVAILLRYPTIRFLEDGAA